MLDHVLVIPSKRFMQILQELHNSFGIPDSLKQKLSENEENKDNRLQLTTQEIKWCHTKMRERGITTRVYELLNESEVILPKYEDPPRNPELEARIQRLKFEQENREYRKMVRSVDSEHLRAGGNLGEIGKDLRTVNRHIISGMQYLLSIVGSFFGMYFALGLVTQEYSTRIFLAVLFAFLVGLAELYYVIREDLREEDRIEKKKI